MTRISMLAVCLILIAGPAAAQSKAMIQKEDDEWADAFNKGDPTALAAMYSEDAYLLPPGAEMMKGRHAIAAFWQQQMRQIGDIKCTALDVKPLGRNSAREIGTCSFKTKAQPPQDGALKYAVVWEKEGPNWRLIQDIWNTNK
jgi:uncharacterized protein (TIGR02246 family)